jgi:type IV secretory pathway protease TraF
MKGAASCDHNTHLNLWVWIFDPPARVFRGWFAGHEENTSDIESVRDGPRIGFAKWRGRGAVYLLLGKSASFRIPASVRPYVRSRTGRDGQDWYILKPLAAGPGDRVETTDGELRINGRFIAPMPPMRDGFGNLLPRWTQNRVLGRDEYFVFSDRIPNSFDSRCYGPVKRDEIESVRRPLIIW